MRLIISSVFLFASGLVMCQELTMAPMSDWNIRLSETDLRAGEDFISTLTSNEDQSKITMEVGPADFYYMFLNSWSLSVERSGGNWDNDLELYIRRTGSGQSVGFFFANISGGESFVRVNKSSREFFHGNGYRYDVPVQLEIRGISLTLSTDTYSTDLIFTVIDN